MTKLRALLLGVVIAALGTWAIAQTITNRSISGTATLDTSVGGPGGQIQVTTVSQLRNTRGVTTTALTSGTLSTLNTSTAALISTAASVSLTVNLPARPFDGEIFEWINGTAGTAFTAGTVAVTDGSTIAGGATPTAAGTVAAGASVEWCYVLSTNTWYRIR